MCVCVWSGQQNKRAKIWIRSKLSKIPTFGAQFGTPRLASAPCHVCGEAWRIPCFHVSHPCHSLLWSENNGDNFEQIDDGCYTLVVFVGGGADVWSARIHEVGSGSRVREGGTGKDFHSGQSSLSSSAGYRIIGGSGNDPRKISKARWATRVHSNSIPFRVNFDSGLDNVVGFPGSTQVTSRCICRGVHPGSSPLLVLSAHALGHYLEGSGVRTTNHPHRNTGISDC